MKNEYHDHQVLRAYLPDGVAEQLGYYVYLYIDPRNGHPFYVGKGKGERILAHFEDDRDSKKVRIITELSSQGISPRLEILAHGLKDEETAFRVEAAAIDLLGLDSLANKVRGWKSLQTGRMTLDELMGYYKAEPVTVTHPALLIRVNQLYRHNMSPLELYEITRGIWKVGPRRSSVKLAMAVFEGIVREVYEVQEWSQALTTNYSTRDLSERDRVGRWEFTGRVAADHIRESYRLRSVRSYFRRGNQSPTIYVNC
jgi:hypothetical protein